MQFCTSWDHAKLAWDGYDNESCPLCHALKLSEAKDKAIVELKQQIEQLTKKKDKRS